MGVTLEVEVTDISGKTIDGPVRLDISVIDQNDNRPMFKEGPYVGHVMEGSPTGIHPIKLHNLIFLVSRTPILAKIFCTKVNL
ncbi:cadherin-13 [Grus japonensis]|uniref:Cadherin-13 n=1 Tax=Grus japonensis TaxID=30415 RepID=A0ABC9XCS7_GRUJA